MHDSGMGGLDDMLASVTESIEAAKSLAASEYPGHSDNAIDTLAGAVASLRDLVVELVTADRPTLPLNADEWQIAETWDAKPPEGWRDRHDVFLVQVCAAANEEMGHALGFLWARKRTGKGE